MDEPTVRTGKMQEKLRNEYICDIIDEADHILPYVKHVVPFPSTLNKNKSSFKVEILDIFEHVNINILLLKAIK